MPSGFTQDLNQLNINFYRVAINMPGYPTEVSAAGSDTNGGVTPTASDAFAVANLPSSLGYGKARARGNMRFRNIVNRLSGLGDCQVLDITITEANGDSQATALAFTVKFERDQFIPLTGSLQGTAVVGNDVAGNAMDSIAKSIKNAVVQGILDATSANVRVYDGTNKFDSEYEIVVAAPDTVANVYADVTVTINEDTTLAS